MELPHAAVKRLIQTSSSQPERPMTCSGDAVRALSAVGQTFVHYVAFSADCVCKDSRRQTVSAEDVLAAVGHLELQELQPSLREALVDFHKQQKAKKDCGLS